MKRIIHIIIVALAVTACNGAEKVCPKPIEEFITNLYNNYVFDCGNLDDIADNFSPSVLDSLRKAYDYDSPEPGYAVWLFRTGINDGEQSLDSIKVDGKDLYTAYITDGSIPCACQMHIVMQDDRPVMMGFKTEYEDPAADFCRKFLSIDELDGQWLVSALDNEGILYANVTMTFDTNEKTFGVCAGCNQIGGMIARNERSADALRFENVGMTQMACEEEIEKLERGLAQALEKVRSFYGVGVDVFMADENDNVVLHLIPAVDSVVPYTIAEGYFFKTGQSVPSDAVVIMSKANLEEKFGYAATMSARPTEIAFGEQAAIAIVLPETDKATQISINSVISRGYILEVSYSVQEGESLSYTILPMCMIIVEKASVRGKVVLVEN